LGRQDSNHCISESNSLRLSARGGRSRTCASRVKLSCRPVAKESLRRTNTSGSDSEMQRFESRRPSQPVRSPPRHMLRSLKTARYAHDAQRGADGGRRAAAGAAAPAARRLRRRPRLEFIVGDGQGPGGCTEQSGRISALSVGLSRRSATLHPAARNDEMCRVFASKGSGSIGFFYDQLPFAGRAPPVGTRRPSYQPMGGTSWLTDLRSCLRPLWEQR